MENMNIFRLLEALIYKGQAFEIDAYLDAIIDGNVDKARKIEFKFKKLEGDDNYNITASTNCSSLIDELKKFFELDENDHLAWFVKNAMARIDERDLVDFVCYVFKKSEAVGYGPIK